MGFFDVWKTLDPDETLARINGATEHDVRAALDAHKCSVDHLMALLSPAAVPFLEDMARKAHESTLRHFGRQILLFTPIYISNHCINQCVYCGFNAKNKIHRRQLTLEEVEFEAAAIAETGLKHILLLTGEAPNVATPAYIEESLAIISKYFTSVGIEIYPVDEDGYARFVNAGADSLTVYQETYNEDLYKTLHPAGPKRDFRFRLEALERGARARMRGINLGGLLGLDHWRREAFFTAMHADWIMTTFPEVELGLSLPRMRPHAGCYEPAHIVSDTDIVQAMTAFRLFLPRAGITLSTRESAAFRDNVLPLGITRLSAGSCTSVGSHTEEEGSGQFDINDERSVVEMDANLRGRGYQPVYQDWRMH
ncbi:2-iminoacetate synthase ThiH [Desulfoluna butyratoxydans]|uniref:Thiazole biosynthesis thih n=1 Tax=Desulfoluna butyratoxydans TaxID=231438 RepID=A0A4U8YMZ5_9BACT|nr:2-iminoacetate synthase ThiH [Desulfoluna butyratoxydans]VFQ45150.1 thiazole biosynthesis thih [Desulfoluna butyratoxydans]